MVTLKKNQLDQFVEFIASLGEKLRNPLPGLDAQLKMTSSLRIRELMNFTVPGDAQPSGVLILLYPLDGKIFTVFILRPPYEGVHGGQVSFPGGKQEPGDQNIIQTALREASEEIGVNPGDVQIIGKLTDLYIPPSNFLVSPIIGYTLSRPSFKVDTFEVERLIEAELTSLLFNPVIEHLKIVIREGIKIEAPAYITDGNIIWGATAMIVSELREIVNKS
jgi:8-oxo-dGTP pyrophosphatase MutT (NUDIX family)